ncbi:MAG: cytochrome c oxidase accessory protein CcoG [FCB group bacterium]|nr:cytochrome c oxidase accessory protein CcoG [FCB group bacterium]
MLTARNSSESFRDKISTIDDKGGRAWIYPKKPSGRFYTYRSLLSYVLLILLFAGPFMTINGRPILLLNFLERKFFIFGVAFWPQDFHLLVLTLIIGIVFIILFTVVFGRLFCGWVCPQTIFMEMVFRKIEYFIEGDAAQQRKLSRAPMSALKFFKRAVKYTIFFAISFVIGNTFLAYIIGKDELFRIITDPPSQHIGGLVGILFFSTLFFGVFAWFREQACVLVCPYGRLQGVLLDPNSIVVHYDFKRGEPRGAGKRSENDHRGDCIDCHQCVEVCPTGIDIRNGTQLECVNCTACIDACDSIMTKINKPKGLIKYSSYNAIENGVSKIMTPKTLGYMAILVLLTAVLTVMLMNRQLVETSILRTPGVMYQIEGDGKISNLYNIKVVNKTFEKQNISLELLSPKTGSVSLVGDLTIAEDDLGETAFFVELPQSTITSQMNQIILGVLANGELIETIKTNFLGPEKQ